MTAELRVLRTKRLGRKPGPLRAVPAAVIPMPHIAMPEIQHSFVYEVMAGMSEVDRAKFWRDHIDTLGQAYVDAGLSEAVAAAILDDHFKEVRRIAKVRGKSEKRKSTYPINFGEPPAIGTEIQIGKRLARLIEVQPITRKSDGAATFLLVWDIEGRRATSGLRASGVYFERGRDDER